MKTTSFKSKPITITLSELNAFLYVGGYQCLCDALASDAPFVNPLSGRPLTPYQRYGMRKVLESGLEPELKEVALACASCVDENGCFALDEER